MLLFKGSMVLCVVAAASSLIHAIGERLSADMVAATLWRCVVEAEEGTKCHVHPYVKGAVA
jgi:hypothetical protein